MSYNSIADESDARFLIDAVIPYNRKTGIPTANCNDTKDFDIKELESLRDDLEFAWPDWPKNEEITKWEDEWKRSGMSIGRTNAKVIYPLFMKRASLHKKGIDYLSNKLSKN